jgi:membrane-associated phospholipid phosphatase
MPRTGDAAPYLLWAGACAAATLWLGIAAFDSPAFAAADVRALYGFTDRHGPDALAGVTTALSHMTGSHQFLAAAVVLVAVVWIRGRPRTAAAIAGLLAGSQITTQVLQQLTAAHRAPVWLPDDIWPSGHTTSAMAIALCLVLAVPPAVRPLVGAVAGLWVVSVVFSILHLAQHHPSDVLAALTVTGAWAALALAWLARAEQRTVAENDAGGVPRGRLRPLGVAAAITALSVALMVAHAVSMLRYGAAEVSFAVAAGVIGAATIALAAAVSVAAVGR